MIKTRGRPPSRLERKCREPDLVKALQTSIQQFHVPTQQKPPGDPANKPFQHMIQHFHAGSSSFSSPPPTIPTPILPAITPTPGLVPLAPNPKTYSQPPVPIPFNPHFYAVPQGAPRPQTPGQNAPIMPAPQRNGQHHPLVAPHPLTTPVAQAPSRVKKEKLDEGEDEEEDVAPEECPTEMGDGEYVVDYFANYQGENMNDEDFDEEDEDDEDFDDEEDKLTITVEPIKDEPL